MTQKGMVQTYITAILGMARLFKSISIFSSILYTFFNNQHLAILLSIEKEVSLIPLSINMKKERKYLFCLSAIHFQMLCLPLFASMLLYNRFTLESVA